MKIMISACVTGQNCKYNGGNNLNEQLVKLLEGHEVIPVCPEVMGGLEVPRSPCEIVDGMVTTREGKDVDRQFRLGARKCLDIARQEKPDLIILMSRSPSCGVGQRYDGSFSGKLIPGNGLTAQLLLDHGFTVMDVADPHLTDLLDLSSAKFGLQAKKSSCTGGLFPLK